MDIHPTIDGAEEKIDLNCEFIAYFYRSSTVRGLFRPQDLAY